MVCPRPAPSRSEVARTELPGAAVEPVLAARDAVVVDLRSPAEHADDHLPGAHNVPLFDDTERAVVGTLYRQRSPEAAFRAGVERAAARIGALVARVAELAGWRAPGVDLAAEVRRRTQPGQPIVTGELAVRPLVALPENPVVLHCWRGGLRSRSVAALLLDLGLERTVVLEGGYKAYRRCVRGALDAWRPAGPVVVLRGLTGVGKTLVLNELEALHPGSTVDLEGLADHRGSVLGMVGRSPVTQKSFESRLRARLVEVAAANRGDGVLPPGTAVLEGESRKVGDTVLPASLWRALQAGVSLELDAPLERRVEVLRNDYLARPESREELRRRLPFLEQRLGPRKWGGELVARLDGREDELVEILLERYYDPLYRRSEKGLAYAARIDASDPARAAREVARHVADLASPDGP